MTKFISGQEMAKNIELSVPGSVTESTAECVWVKSDMIREVCHSLKDVSGMDFSYLTSISAVDYIDKFEIVYHLLSMRNNYAGIVKSICIGREQPSIPSVIEVWKGADLQEREIWDLMGIDFQGHPNLKRILLWEGFDGHPLRKDYLG
ncbi:MAG: NADH-quinone oxidoreductase subunit C [Dehalococcoidia bacterium]